MSPEDLSKRCGSCKEVKSFIEFPNCKTEKYGLHHTCRACHHQYYIENKEQKAEYNKAYRPKARLGQARRRYNIPESQVEEIYSRGCEICGTKEGKLCIDHCHDSGKVRGCLCDYHNKLLGHYEKWCLTENMRDFKNKANNYLKKKN